MHLALGILAFVYVACVWRVAFGVRAFGVFALAHLLQFSTAIDRQTDISMGSNTKTTTKTKTKAKTKTKNVKHEHESCNVERRVVWQGLFPTVHGGGVEVDRGLDVGSNLSHCIVHDLLNLVHRAAACNAQSHLDADNLFAQKKKLKKQKKKKKNKKKKKKKKKKRQNNTISKHK